MASTVESRKNEHRKIWQRSFALVALVFSPMALVGCASSGTTLDYSGTEPFKVAACAEVASSQDRSDPGIPYSIRSYDIDDRAVNPGIEPYVFDVKGLTEARYSESPTAIFSWSCEATLSPTDGTLVAELTDFVRIK
jgi:hypothetical protein